MGNGAPTPLKAAPEAWSAALFAPAPAVRVLAEDDMARAVTSHDSAASLALAPSPQEVGDAPPRAVLSLAPPSLVRKITPTPPLSDENAADDAAASLLKTVAGRRGVLVRATPSLESALVGELGHGEVVELAANNQPGAGAGREPRLLCAQRGETGRGDAAGATWMVRGDDERARARAREERSTDSVGSGGFRRGRDADIPRERVAATPRPRRGYSVETGGGRDLENISSKLL